MTASEHPRPRPGYGPIGVTPTYGGFAKIILFCVALNVALLSITAFNRSLLFLDMTGTAIAAATFGPIGGAITAIATNLIGEHVLGATDYSAYAFVNVAGAMFWARLFRSSRFNVFDPTQSYGTLFFSLLKIGVMVGAATSFLSWIIAGQFAWNVLSPPIQGMTPSFGDHPAGIAAFTIAGLITSGEERALVISLVTVLLGTVDKTISTFLAYLLVSYVFIVGRIDNRALPNGAIDTRVSRTLFALLILPLLGAYVYVYMLKTGVLLYDFSTFSAALISSLNIGCFLLLPIWFILYAHPRTWANSFRLLGMRMRFYDGSGGHPEPFFTSAHELARHAYGDCIKMATVFYTGLYVTLAQFGELSTEKKIQSEKISELSYEGGVGAIAILIALQFVAVFVSRLFSGDRFPRPRAGRADEEDD